MKLKKGFVLREVANECVVVPAGEDINFNGMITLNITGKLLWECLDKGATLEELVAAVCAKFDIDDESATADVKEFVEKLEGRGFIE